MSRTASIVAIPALAVMLGACSLGQSLTTGSVLGGKQVNAGAASVPPPAPPVTATDRLVQVAATSARAERCGFNFDPTRLRANYLAAESAAGGAPPDLVQKYDSLRKSVVAAIVTDDGYCSEGRTRVIKADLSRHLAGDYAPPARKQDTSTGWFESAQSPYRERETINPEILDDPKAAKTRRVQTY